MNLDLVRAIPTQYMLLGIAALVAASAGFGYVKGMNHEADRHTEYVRQVTEANARLEAENARIKRETKRINKETTAGWAAAVDHLRSNPVRVRRADCGAATSAAVSTSAGRPEPDAAERGLGAGLSTPIEIPAEQCEARLNAAARDAAQVMWLLDWAAAQREATLGE
jgi:hypothetical protein